MDDFKQEWDLAMALEVLASPKVDGATWSAAVKWLLFYGPPELRELIGQASHFATSEHFPDLKPTGYDDEGAPCYDTQALAAALGLTADELAKQLVKWEDEAGQPAVVNPATVHRVH
jgi:hypothetical protein